MQSGLLQRSPCISTPSLAQRQRLHAAPLPRIAGQATVCPHQRRLFVPRPQQEADSAACGVECRAAAIPVPESPPSGGAPPLSAGSSRSTAVPGSSSSISTTASNCNPSTGTYLQAIRDTVQSIFLLTTTTPRHHPHHHLPPGGLGTALAKVRALLFAAWTFTLAVPLFIIMMVLAPIVLVTDKFRWVGWGWLDWCTGPGKGGGG